MIELSLLIQNCVQFGHQTWRWCPRMAPFIWGKKNGIHLIDVSKTAQQLERAAQFLESIASEGKQILWIGTKPAAKETVDAIGRRLRMPAVAHRWIGGTLTNNSQVKKSITKLLHLKDVIEKYDKEQYTKKELGTVQKLADRLNKNVGGIQTLNWPVGALVVVDIRKEHSAVREAIAAGVPVVAIVDTNNDPSTVEYPIPANDDVARSIRVLLDYLADAAERGYKVAKASRKAPEAAASAVAQQQEVAQLVEQAIGLSEEETNDNKKKARPVVGGAQPKRPVNARGGSAPRGGAPRRGPKRGE